MKKRTHSILFILLVYPLTLFNCSFNQEKKESLEFIPYKIDLSPEAYFKAELPKNSLFFKEVDYVALETTEQSRIKNDYKVYASKDYIYTVAYRQILQFDRKTGKFIKEIGSYGYEIQNYTSTLPNVQSTNSNEILVLNSQGLSKINAVTNEFTKVSPRPSPFHDVAELNQDGLISFVSGDNNKIESHLLQFSKDGNELNQYYLNQTNYDPSSLVLSFGFQEGNFHSFNNEVFFKQIYNDTLYKVSEKGLSKYAYFNLGEFDIDWNKEIIQSEIYNNIIIINTYESEAYIFFIYWYRGSIKYGVYNKANQTSYLPEHNWMEDGFVDDLLGFIDFRPQSINEHNELVASFPTFEILFFLNSYGDESSIPKPLKALKMVKDGDNPVIGIATLK
ncbi:MAG: 6-bladed beta-propeller [Cytophagia bacterium]|nr:6-bladed beta-propeller [Cytophagia bacterium]